MRKAIVLLYLIAFLSSCKEEKKGNVATEALVKISGPTMGTTYNITYQDDLKRDFTHAIDSILVDINNSVSTYIPTSLISRINKDSLGKRVQVLQNEQLVDYIRYTAPADKTFIHNFRISQEVFRSTSGYFDPTIMPLVNYWGFGYTKKKARTDVSETKIKELKKTIGLEKWSLSTSQDSFTLLKHPKSELDFSAIAKGYAVDELSNFLKSKSITNHLVEIGGEIFCSGTKNGKPWSVGINRPVKDASLRSTNLVIQLSGKAMASSGNYRNFYEVDGETYGHEINPHTGHPEKNDLLGVSVLAPDCMMADALATAFMVLGRDRSVKLVEGFVDIEAVFFYSDDGKTILKQYSSSFDSFLSRTDS